MSTKVVEDRMLKVDFKSVCSCQECIPKIKYLKDFDEFMVSKKKVVRELLSIFCNCQQKLPVEDFLLDADQSIKRTFREMNKVKRAFWALWRKNNDTHDRGHTKTGLSTTLDLLKEKAAAFYAEWDNRFAPFFPLDNELEETSMPTEAEASVEDLLKGFSFELSGCYLFPPDFEKDIMCSCKECFPKTKDLEKLERFILSKYKAVLAVNQRYLKARNRCDCIVVACDWSESTMDSFLLSLKEVYDKQGEKFTEGGRGLKIKIEIMSLYKSLAESGWYPLYENSPAAAFVNQIGDLAKDIDFDIGSRGMFYYENTKFFREEGQHLLNEILQIEANFQNAKKSVADNGKSLDPSISKGLILQQILCLEKLPIKGLRTEAEACIAKLSDIFPKKHHLVNSAKNSIKRTYREMDVVTREFRQKIETNKGEGEHELTGFFVDRLKGTGYDDEKRRHELTRFFVDQLIEKAEAFKVDWENSFVHLFPSPTDQPKDN